MFKTLLSTLLAIALLSSCALPQVSAEDRLFLDVSLDLTSSVVLPKQTLDGDPFGGISAIAYDAPSDRLYALSDNRDRPRFYTFATSGLTTEAPALTLESVTYLKDEQGNPFTPGDLDPEGMALTPGGTLLISSEGSAARSVAPAIGEYSLTTGQLQKALPLPTRYIPDSVLAKAADPNAQKTALSDPTNSTDLADLSAQTQGVQENLSFESLTINVSSGTGGIYEPYRLFVATEGPLLQDLDFAPDIPYKNRLLHYTIDPYQTTLISEHLYAMDIAPTGAVLHGLSEIALLDQGGHFLGIERSYGFQGFAIKLYQLASGGATDISAIASLAGDTSGISPIRKELVLDLATLPFELLNYEAIAFGPAQPDGSRTLLLMNDDNFDEDQDTRLLIFKLQQS